VDVPLQEPCPDIRDDVASLPTGIKQKVTKKWNDFKAKWRAFKDGDVDIRINGDELASRYPMDQKESIAGKDEIETAHETIEITMSDLNDLFEDKKPSKTSSPYELPSVSRRYSAATHGPNNTGTQFLTRDPPYLLGKVIGQGAFGQVFAGFNYSNNETVAIKKCLLGPGKRDKHWVLKNGGSLVSSFFWRVYCNLNVYE
jgi:hypothetical protein